MTDCEKRPEIFTIDPIQCGDRIDVAYIQNADHRRAVTNLVTDYKPNKLQETDIKMTIVLKNDEPIYQKARRLPQAEKDIVNT